MNFPTNADLMALEAAIQGSGHISADNVLALRRAIYRSGSIQRSDVDAIFRLNRMTDTADRTWGQFYVEALTDFFFWQRPSDSPLEEKDARLLLDWITEDGRISDRNEIMLLVSIMSRALSCPESLQHFALKAIKDSVLNDREALYSNGVRRPGAVNEDDVETIRKVIYGLGSQGGIGVSQEEAELLFEINSHTATSENAPTWQTLFVKAVTMYVLYNSKASVGVEETKALWLESQFVEGRSCYRNEVALLSYLEQEAGSLPSRLSALRDRLQAAQAAA